MLSWSARFAGFRRGDDGGLVPQEAEQRRSTCSRRARCCSWSTGTRRGSSNHHAHGASREGGSRIDPPGRRTPGHSPARSHSPAAASSFEARSGRFARICLRACEILSSIMRWRAGRLMGSTERSFLANPAAFLNRERRPDAGDRIGHRPQGERKLPNYFGARRSLNRHTLSATAVGVAFGGRGRHERPA